MERKDVWTAGDLYEPYVGRWSRLVAREFLDWLSRPTDEDWLDVGCGTGALTQVIIETTQPRTVTGIDPSAEFVSYAQEQIAGPGVSFKVEMANAAAGAWRFDGRINRRQIPACACRVG